MDEQSSGDGPDSPWQFKPDGQESSQTTVPPADSGQDTSNVPAPDDSSEDDPGLTWRASEFIAHHKSVSWYLFLALGGAVLTVGVYVITKDKVSTGVAIIASIAFGIYGARQPREVQYNLNMHGLTIGNRFFPYERFRSFSVVDEGAFSSITFAPLKRFDPPTTIYYAPDDEKVIVELLSARLPIEPASHDMIDRFMRKIHF